MNYFDRFDSCLLCGSSDIDSLESYEKHYLFRCRECKFVFVVRRPSGKELSDHYDLYPRANSISEITLRRYEALLDKFEKYRQSNNLIDIGCGDGYFLEVAMKRKWNVFGTEFSQEAMDVCQGQGIKMIRSPFDPSCFEEGSFDVITSFEVIEHINTPQDEVRIFHRLLRRGGMAYVTTPNWNSISRNILNSKWNVIEYPEHLCYYTRKTLRKLFSAHNFRAVEISTTGISINRIGAGTTIVKSGGGENNIDEKLRQKMEDKFVYKYSKDLINMMLNVSGKGDSIKALFQKQ